MFGKKQKKKQDLNPVSDAELETGMRVMQDDLDELSGKKTPKQEAMAPDVVAAEDATGSPFLSGAAPPSRTSKKREPKPSPRKKRSVSDTSGTIVFDTEETSAEPEQPAQPEVPERKSGGILGFLFGKKDAAESKARISEEPESSGKPEIAAPKKGTPVFSTKTAQAPAGSRKPTLEPMSSAPGPAARGVDIGRLKQESKRAKAAARTERARKPVPAAPKPEAPVAPTPTPKPTSQPVSKQEPVSGVPGDMQPKTSPAASAQPLRIRKDDVSTGSPLGSAARYAAAGKMQPLRPTAPVSQPSAPKRHAPVPPPKPDTSLPKPSPEKDAKHSSAVPSAADAEMRKKIRGEMQKKLQQELERRGLEMEQKLAREIDEEIRTRLDETMSKKMREEKRLSEARILSEMEQKLTQAFRDRGIENGVVLSERLEGKLEGRLERKLEEDEKRIEERIEREVEKRLETQAEERAKLESRLERKIEEEERKLENEFSEKLETELDRRLKEREEKRDIRPTEPQPTQEVSSAPDTLPVSSPSKPDSTIVPMSPDSKSPPTSAPRKAAELESMLASLGSHEESAPAARPAPDSAPSPGAPPSADTSEAVSSAPKTTRNGDIPIPETSGSVSVWRSRWVLPIAALFLIAIVAGAAGYFYFATEPEPTVFEATPEPTEPVEIADTPEPEPEPFSREMPNPLILDTESADATPTGINQMLTETEAQVRAMNPTLPIEFIVRDANNNPVAFSRFAFLAGLSLPSDTLAVFDEGFSIYYVMDGEQVRRALSLEIREDTDALSLLRAGETGMPGWFSGLLYDRSVALSDSPEFRDGSYGTLETRYTNFESDGLSLDYAILDDSLIVGTSKDSFRAALGNVIRIR